MKIVLASRADGTHEIVLTKGVHGVMQLSLARIQRDPERGCLRVDLHPCLCYATTQYADTIDGAQSAVEDLVWRRLGGRG